MERYVLLLYPYDVHSDSRCSLRVDSKQFGKPLGAFQLVQKKLADASMEAASTFPPLRSQLSETDSSMLL